MAVNKRAYEQLDLAPAGSGERERPDLEGPAGGHVEDDVVRGGARDHPRVGEGLGKEPRRWWSVAVALGWHCSRQTKTYVRQCCGSTYLGVIRDAVADGAEVVEREEDAGLGGVRQESRGEGGREQKQHGPPRHRRTERQSRDEVGGARYGQGT